jgi:hypothetical protein
MVVVVAAGAVAAVVVAAAVAAVADCRIGLGRKCEAISLYC